MVLEVFTTTIIETINVGPSIRHDISFDVMSRFVSHIFYDVPIVSSMDMSYYEYFPVCYNCVYDSPLSLSQHSSISHAFDIDDEHQSSYLDSKTLPSHSSSGDELIDEDFGTIDFGIEDQP